MAQFFAENLDCVLFSTLALGAALALHGWTQARCPESRSIRRSIFFWCLLFVLIGTGWAAARWLGQEEAQTS
ncbi:MAG: hypothetical protein FJ404_19115 [Verrucomicrobia bacterium]|nr:hypothetical protein [Verrucomicrobiota bacterium]